MLKLIFAFYQNDYQMLDLSSKRRIAKFNYDKKLLLFHKTILRKMTCC